MFSEHRALDAGGAHRSTMFHDAWPCSQMPRWWHGSLWFGHSTGPGRRCQEFAPRGDTLLRSDLRSSCVARVNVATLLQGWTRIDRD